MNRIFKMFIPINLISMLKSKISFYSLLPSASILMLILKNINAEIPFTSSYLEPCFHCNICSLKINLCGEFVCVEVLWPSQPNGVMSSAVSLPNHTFTGQA